jgi:hypothetical protein
MDPLAHQRRLGIKIGDEIADSTLVERKRAKDTDSGRLILQLVCHRLSAHLPSSEKGDPVLAFLGALAFDDSALRERESDVTGPFLEHQAPSFIDRHHDVIGTEFAADLKKSFQAAADSGHLTNWLTISFGLASERYTKGMKGLSANEERNFEVADSVARILKQLKGGKLKRQVEAYLSGAKQTLPVCLEREIRLWGYPTTAGYAPETQEALADAINTEYRPAERQHLAGKVAEITKDDKRSATTAAQIYIECVQACGRLIDKIMADKRSTPDRARLAERRRTLNQYGAASRGKSARGVGVRGIQSIHKRYKDRLPHWTARRNDTTDADALKALAREQPAIREALRIIRSSDVDDKTKRDTLRKLQKHMPRQYEHADFEEILSQIAGRMNKLDRPT